ncbi:MAG: HNH endonuclease [Bacteroidales bacterium]|nr:HNH endonuclease [Bacteroidales bacterium]
MENRNDERGVCALLIIGGIIACIIGLSNWLWKKNIFFWGLGAIILGIAGIIYHEKRINKEIRKQELRKIQKEKERIEREKIWEEQREDREKKAIKLQILEKEIKKQENLRKKEFEAQIKAEMIEEGIISNDDDTFREPIPQDIQDRVWNRDGGKCVKCGSQEKLEFDHFIPFSKGGSNTYRNLQILCEKCNRSKSNNIG